MQDLIIIGGGGHARVVIEAARSMKRQWHVQGFVDPNQCAETQARMNVARLGDDAVLSQYPNAALVLGVGNTSVTDLRRDIVARVGSADGRWATIVHQSAWVSPTATLGAGTVVLAGAVINSGAQLGEHCIVNSFVCVDHDAALGHYVHASHGSLVAGGAVVGDNSYLGMGSLIRDHITIGRDTLVGMGAVVTKGCENGSRLVGIPAKDMRREQ